jgi:hypothetical protein
MTMPGGLIGRALGAFGGQPPRPTMDPAAAPGAGIRPAPAGSMITSMMPGLGGPGMAPRGGTVPLRPPVGLGGMAFGGGAPGGPQVAPEGPGMMGQRPTMMPGGPMAGQPMPGGAGGALGSILGRLFPGQGQGVAGGFKGQGGPFAAAGGAPAPAAAPTPTPAAAPRPPMFPQGMTVNGSRQMPMGGKRPAY